ncbi:hypothetical protein D3C76_1233700 [compost metagenome]
MVYLEEPILHPVQIFLADSNTAIHNFHKNMRIRFQLDYEVNPTVLIREFNRIIDKIKKNLFKSISISIYEDIPIFIAFQLNLNPFLLGFSPHIKHSFLKDFL